MRNLSGGGPANPRWPYQPAAARTAAGSCGSSGVFRSMPVGPGVLLCWLARSLPRVRYKTLPAGLLGGENGIKLSLHAEKAPNWAISGEQGEFCTAHAARAGVQGEFCTEAARCGCCWANNAVLWRSPRASRRAMAAPWRCSCALRPGSPCPRRSPRRWRWGFCTTRSPLTACRRRVEPPCSAIPPIGGGAGVVCGGVAAKVQTHWVKDGEKSLLWLNESTFWRIRPLAWFVAHTRTRYREREPAISHVIPRRPLQRLNYHPWNCNVCRLSQKVTALNYVRLLEEATPDICHGTTCIKGHFRPH